MTVSNLQKCLATSYSKLGSIAVESHKNGRFHHGYYFNMRREILRTSLAEIPFLDFLPFVGKQEGILRLN